MKNRRIVFSLIMVFAVVLLITNSVKPLGSDIPHFTVGILAASDAKIKKIEGFRQGMANLGFIEGSSVDYVIYNAEGKREDLLSLAGQLADIEPNVLVATGGVEADALKAVTSDSHIPVVFIGSASSIERGLVKSLLQPGFNLTGVDNYHAELAGKRLELLIKLLPSVKRVAVIYDPKVPPGYQSLKIIRETANILGLEIGTIEISSKEEMINKLQPDKLYGYDALLPLSSFFIEAISGDLLDISLRNRIPVMGIYGQDLDNNFFASYGVSMENQGLQGARLVAKVLDGQRPEQIPVETPDNLDLIVNLRTAEKLGLELSETGLSFAKVILKK